MTTWTFFEGSLTDEALRNRSFYGAEAADLLLLVPEGQRQDVEAEVSRRRHLEPYSATENTYQKCMRIRRAILAERGWLTQ